MRVYRYPLNAVFPFYFFGIAFVLMFGGAASALSYGLIYHRSEFHGALWQWMLMVLAWLLCALMYPVIWLYAFRPVSVGPDGIRNFRGQRELRFIPWTEITKIDRVRTIDQSNWQKRTQFWFYGKSTKIMFDNRISGLTALVDGVNEQIQVHHIPVFNIQKPNTLRQQVPALVLYDALTGNQDEGARTPLGRV